MSFFLPKQANKPDFGFTPTKNFDILQVFADTSWHIKWMEYAETDHAQVTHFLQRYVRSCYHSGLVGTRQQMLADSLCDHKPLWVESDTENSRHCLSDGHQKGPERLEATGHGWLFVCAASLSLCVDLWLPRINCSDGTDVSAQCLTALLLSRYENITRDEARLKWLADCKNTDRCGSSYDIPPADVVSCTASPFTSGRTDWPKYIIKVTANWRDRCRVIPLALISWATIACHCNLLRVISEVTRSCFRNMIAWVVYLFAVANNSFGSSKTSLLKLPVSASLFERLDSTYKSFCGSISS